MVSQEFPLTHLIFKGGLLKALAYKAIFIFYYYALAINAGDDDASLPFSAESYLFTLW